MENLSGERREWVRAERRALGLPAGVWGAARGGGRWGAFCCQLSSRSMRARSASLNTNSVVSLTLAPLFSLTLQLHMHFSLPQMRFQRADFPDIELLQRENVLRETWKILDI